MNNAALSIAIPKGRLLEPTLEVLLRAGIECPDTKELDRRLVFNSTDGSLRFIMARPSDVPTYVECGAADLGITGKDVLLEGGLNVCELLDLGFGKCKMVLAAPAEAPAEAPAAPVGRGGEHVLRVATKFPAIARRHFAGMREVCVQIIKLNGAVEIAPITGLADRILDIVDTGRTLRENGLVVVEEVLRVSARLIANRASMQLKADSLQRLVSAMAAAAPATSANDYNDYEEAAR